MKHRFSSMLFSFWIILLLTGCNLPEESVATPVIGIVSTKVASTLAAMTKTAQLTPFSTTQALPTMSKPTATLSVTGTPAITPGPSPTLTLTLKPSNTPAATRTPIPEPGSISGSISGYPYGPTPGLSIVAYQQEAPYNYGFVITGAGQTFYVNNSEWLIPGHYQVVAYDSSGHSGGCPVLVLVISKQSVTCDITSWGGGYRAKPADVPNP